MILVTAKLGHTALCCVNLDTVLAGLTYLNNYYFLSIRCQVIRSRAEASLAEVEYLDLAQLAVGKENKLHSASSLSHRLLSEHAGGRVMYNVVCWEGIGSSLSLNTGSLNHMTDVREEI